MDQVLGILETEIVGIFIADGVVDCPVLPGASADERPEEYVSVVGLEAQWRAGDAYLVEMEFRAVVPLDDEGSVERQKERFARVVNYINAADSPLRNYCSSTLMIHGLAMRSLSSRVSERARAEVAQVRFGATGIAGEALPWQASGWTYSAPDLRATEEDAQEGISNKKWMTPLRVWDAIRAWSAANFSWGNLAGKPSTFPPTAHTHTAAEITGLSTGFPPPDWATLAGKPSTFPPSSHTHQIGEVDGLESALAAKQTAGSYAPATHAHGLADVAGLQAALDARQPVGNYATAAQGTKADSALQPAALTPYRAATAQDAIDSGKAASTHTHTASQITDFAAAVQAVAPTASAPITPANSGLAISGNSLATAYNTAIADGVVSVSVGGAPAAPASAWKSKNIVQVLDDILFPTILASVGASKSLALSVSGGSGALEVGSVVARVLSASFARGTILNGTGAVNANPLVGAATGYTFTGTGISATSQAGSTLAFTTAVVAGSNGWAVTVAHDAGTGVYTDNKGVAGTNLASSRVAGTASAGSSPSVTGVYPYYYLKSASLITAASMAAAIAAGTATKVVASSSGTLTVPYAPSAQYFAVAYPASSTSKATYYVTALDNGAITVVFSPVATQTVATALWSQSYKIHVSATALTNSNSTIELRN